MAVLVDSSVWIAAASPRNPECLHLQRLIRAGEPIYVTRVIQMEVSQGARSETELRDLSDALEGFPRIEVEEKHWPLCARNHFRCRKRGITPSSIDCLIATMAAEARIPLWTLDRAFADMQPVVGFERWTG